MKKRVTWIQKYMLWDILKPSLHAIDALTPGFIYVNNVGVVKTTQGDQVLLDSCF